MSEKESSAMDNHGSSKQNKDELLFRYFEGDVTEEEIERVHEILRTDRQSYELLDALVRDSLEAEDPKSIEEVRKRLQLTPQQQVAKIMEYVDDDKAAAAQAPSGEKGFVAEIKEIFTLKWVQGLAYAAVLVFAFLTGRPIYLAWQSDTLTEEGLAFFTKRHYITSRDELRPAGGFEFSPFTQQRGPQTNLDSTAQYFKKALAKDRDNRESQQYLGTYYLLVENDTQKAEEYYMAAYRQDSTDATILNDLGVLAWSQEKLSEATSYFQASTRFQPKLLEPKYNLAAIYEKQGRIEDAIRTWNAYLELDSTSVWSDIASAHLERLNE